MIEFKNRLTGTLMAAAPARQTAEEPAEEPTAKQTAEEPAEEPTAKQTAAPAPKKKAAARK